MSKEQFRRPLSFRENLDRLPHAFSCGVSAGSRAALRSLLESSRVPYTVVGSGASFSAAVFIARLLEYHFSVPTRAKTPYDFYSSPRLREGVILVSASGENHDILASLDTALSREASPLILVSGNDRNTLVKRSADYPHAVRLITHYEISGEREGFFGVQSLMATIGAFIATADMHDLLKANSPEEWCAEVCRAAEKEAVARGAELDAVAKARHIVALGVGWSLPCLVDLESKFVEGGLGWIEVSEVKNFTHGRYINTLREPSTAVICLSARDERGLFSRIEENIGESFTAYNVHSQRSGSTACLELFVRVFYLVDALATRRKINISRPFVPEGARRLFRGDDLYPSVYLRKELSRRIDAIVEAKLEVAKGLGQAVPRSVVEASFCFLYGVRYGGLACDFDGTLIPLRSKSDLIGQDLLQAILRILRGRVHVAVISGRGKSVVSSLRSQIPSDLAKMLSCYLYNGGVLWNLASAQPAWVRRLDRINDIAARLRSVARGDAAIAEVEISSMGCQVTAHMVDVGQASRIVGIVQEIVLQEGWDVRVRTSGRSVDVFPEAVSKRKAVMDFKSVVGDGGANILVIGDRGDDEGNDFELLQEPFSLSVDRFSSSPSCCFPVVDRHGKILTGPQATTSVLSAAQVEYEGFKITI